MNRIQEALRGCRERGEKAMGLFLTYGFPDTDSTLPILHELDAGGADFIELGMPFSDPLAEGLPVQRSSERALRNGARMKHALETVVRFREKSETPLLLMGYVNLIFHYGVHAFCRDARYAGVDGLILVDLPLEERVVVAGEAVAADLAMIPLIAPNTPDERIAAIDEMTDAFVYAVSITGLTGSGLGRVESVQAYLRRARHLVTRNPLLVGFGIKSHADAARLCEHTDGFIVGSALVGLIERLWDHDALPLERRLEEVRHFAGALKFGSSVPAG